jgi:TRAP-type C4-dicarboxylate transport system, small permease component
MLARLSASLTPWISGLFRYVTAILLFALMALTCVDVIGRYFFNHPVFGGLELTEILLAGLIFSALPLVTMRSEHVVIDLFAAPGGKLKVFQTFFANIAGALACGVLCQQMWLRGMKLARAGETTIQIKIPLDLVAYSISVLLAVTTVAFVIRAFVQPAKVERASGAIS